MRWLAILAMVMCLYGCWWPGKPSQPTPPPAPAVAPVAPAAPEPVNRVCPAWSEATARYFTPDDLAACSCRELAALAAEIGAGRNGFSADNAVRISNYQASAGCSAPAAPPPPETSTRPEPAQPAASRPAPGRPAAGGCPSYDDAAGRNLGSAELAACSCEDLTLLRNEIFARHGRIFDRQDLQEYFSAQAWYRPDRGNINGDRGQNQYERRNVTAILNGEKAAGCRAGRPSSNPGASPGGNCPSWPAQADFRLGAEELQYCSCRELELLRNEIFARHGRVFNRQDLQTYFGGQSWYVPDRSNPNGDRGMNNIERANVSSITSHEKARACR